MIKPIFKKTTVSKRRLLCLLIIAVGLMLIDHYSGFFNPLRSSINTLMQQLQIGFNRISNTVSLIDNFKNNQVLIRHNQQLQQQLLKQQGLKQQLMALQTENKTLRSLLQANNHHDIHTSMARVKAVIATPSRQQLIINHGAMAGVFKGQTVIDGDGIVGQVITVNPQQSTVMLLTDQQSRIPVIDQNQQLSAIATGTGNHNRQLALENIIETKPLAKGDILLSSGRGLRYPSYYPVGKVISQPSDAKQSLITVNVQPLANLYHDDFVLLVWPKKMEHQPS